MLSANNEHDLEKMKKYGRANDMLLLQEFFPEFCPFENLTLIENEQNYLENEEHLNPDAYRRPDSLIGAQKTIITGRWKSTAENLTVLRDIKQQTPDGVMLLFDLHQPKVHRYESGGGMSIGVSVGEKVSIDCLGKGFSGQLLTKGSILPHEIYSIDWQDISGLASVMLRMKKVFRIDDEQYKESVAQWSKFLHETIGYDVSNFKEYIPEKFQGVNKKALLDAVKITNKLPKLEQELKSRKLAHFIIQGEIVNGHFSPWQMSAETRFKSKYQNLRPQKLSLKEWQRVYTSE